MSRWEVGKDIGVEDEISAQGGPNSLGRLKGRVRAFELPKVRKKKRRQDEGAASSEKGAGTELRKVEQAADG